MLFNSTYYIFAFLPAVFFGYFLLQRSGYAIFGKLWLVSASLYFYGYWNPKYLVLILLSIVFNFALGWGLHRTKLTAEIRPNRHKALLITGIVLNLGLLGYFKYADFFLSNINTLLGTEFPLLHLVLPLAISFFTFQQIAYLVDCYQFDTQEYDFLSYCLFVSFFPQLIAGPIVHHKEMMPQFSNTTNANLNWDNVSRGFLIFCIGLFKKVVIADTFAIWANIGYANPNSLTMVEAWATSLSYTFQLYFDFSGYTDMAIGAALLFNIRLPLNFNSPYKAISIQDFWHRWHMTLSRWLRDYVYIPLGGNRRGPTRLYFNLMATFILGGLWHGAGWTFVLWGALHGLGISVHRAWQSHGFRLPLLPAWAITFLFVHVTWIFFRAEDIPDALAVIQGMLGYNGLGARQLATGLGGYKEIFDGWLTVAGFGNVLFITFFALIAFCAKNSIEIGAHRTHFTLAHSLVSVSALLACILLSIASTAPEFLYFNF